MEYVERDLESELWSYMDSSEILAVVGPRQAGKTTLLKKIESELENSNFLTLEDRDLLRLFEEDEKEFAELHLESYDYLVIDEFQYAEEGGRKLKYLYDKYPEKKILITGSSAADMTIQGLKHLTGRVLRFRLKPFSFREFLRSEDGQLYSLFQERENSIQGWVNGEDELDLTRSSLNRLEELRREYAVYGGYPRVAVSDSEQEKQKVLENIVETYLVKEIGDVFGIKEDRKVEDLMKILALQMGEKTNYNSVCQKAEINYKKLKKWLSVLEHSFLLKQVRPFYTNKQKEITKSPKIYFHDNGFRNALIDSFQPMKLRNDRGELNENFFFSQSGKNLKYWRSKSKAEVDFVTEDAGVKAYEIKTNPKTTRSMRSFQDRYEPEKMFVMNEEKIEKRETEVLLPLIFSQKATELQ